MRTSFLLLIGTTAAATALAADIPKDQREFFEKKIQPIFAETCYKCHSVESGKSKGGLLLDTREAVLKGGDTGPAVVPGDPVKSLLITAIAYKDADLQMPPKGEKLSDQQIALLTEWVKMGAPDPREAKGGKLTGLTDTAREHWAYKPVTKPAVPAVQNRAWVATPVDAFILQKIEEKGMAPSPTVDKETLLRRATYNLIGLPPTPQEIEDFLRDQSPYAFYKVVDRLLASPHYGERWGRYWLDTARYADTSGNRNNNRRADYRYPYAWTYRDYVIRSFNEDKPYDRFILEQLAADKLTDLKEKRDLAALGFLTVGDRTGNANDIINDRIDVVSKGFLGLTVACARCHDHMFDPVSTKDYYALHGVFNSIVEPKEAELPVILQASNKVQVEDFHQKMAEYEAKNLELYYSAIDANNAMFRQQAAKFITAWYLDRRQSSAEDKLKSAELRRTENLDQNVFSHLNRSLGRDNPVFTPLRRFAEGKWKDVGVKNLNLYVATAFKNITPKSIDEIAEIYGRIFSSIDQKAREYAKVSAAAKDKNAKIEGFNPELIELITLPFDMKPAHTLDTASIEREVQTWPLQLRNRQQWTFVQMNALKLTHDGSDARAMIVADLPRPSDSRVFIRGQAETRGDVVPRRFLEVLSGGAPKPFKQGSGRLELAQAIASRDNPLTARVIVNRVWLHHFGEGFVRTPDDLGTQAEKPSHPELLDYLASYLMERNWSLKDLHKLIMLSHVYQESSYTVPAHEVIDPDNRLLWRANVRRLDFESMRDSLLVMSGKLDRTVGGQPVNLTDEPYSYRRSIYGYIDRGNLPELMSHFDFSDPQMPNSKRTTTVVPQQALFLMNSPMAIDVARRVVTRPEVMNRPGDLAIVGIYRIILGRSPKPAEIPVASQFIVKEIKEEPKMITEAKAMTEKMAKKATEAAKRMSAARDDGLKAPQNEGDIVERKPLTPWESFAHALLLSNEAAYVN